MRELEALAKKTLPEKRYLHTLEVEKEVRFISRLVCPEHEEELARAALLHDITKYYTLEEHLALAGDIIDGNDIKSPETLHAKSGAMLAKERGETLWQAIECHTTGKPAMTLPEMALFIADYTEAGRAHTECKKEREALRRALNSGMGANALTESVIRILTNTVSYLQGKEVFIHPRTIDALEYYRGIIRGKK